MIFCVFGFLDCWSNILTSETRKKADALSCCLAFITDKVRLCFSCVFMSTGCFAVLIFMLRAFCLLWLGGDAC